MVPYRPRIDKRSNGLSNFGFAIFDFRLPNQEPYIQAKRIGQLIKVFELNRQQGNLL